MHAASALPPARTHCSTGRAPGAGALPPHGRAAGAPWQTPWEHGGARASVSGVSTPACSQGDPAQFYEARAPRPWHGPTTALGAEAEHQVRRRMMPSRSGTAGTRGMETPPPSSTSRAPRPPLLRSLPAGSTEGTARAAAALGGAQAPAQWACPSPRARCRREERQPPRSLAQRYLLLSIY